MNTNERTAFTPQCADDPMLPLKERKIWMLWRTGTRTDKDGKTSVTKIPISARGTNTGTDPKHADDWMTYSEACRAAGQITCAGVGFKIPDGFFFLDVDHRELEDPLVQELLGRYASYAERSYSGRGFHIYGQYDPEAIPTEVNRGRKELSTAYYTKNPHNGLELYLGGLTNRFAAVTGNAVCTVPLRDCTDALLETLEKEMRRKSAAPSRKAKASALRFTPSEDPEEIIRLLRSQKNGKKFDALFSAGDIRVTAPSRKPIWPCAA